jgi:hypothetical protein
MLHPIKHQTYVNNDREHMLKIASNTKENISFLIKYLETYD